MSPSIYLSITLYRRTINGGGGEFTEWTNVRKAKPLFKGHEQPKVPADLGYYDLRNPEVREAQAELAREAGIEGFCYWHYWFGNGKRLLERPFNEVVASGKPDFPFCLCWANHSWYHKTWDAKNSKRLLMEQTYPGAEDYTAHFYAMLPAFRDRRYMKMNGKLLFGIFAPLDIPDPALFFRTWRELAEANGLPGFYFFGYNPRPKMADRILACGYDGVVTDYVRFSHLPKGWLGRTISGIARRILKIPRLTAYDAYMKCCTTMFEPAPGKFASIDPNFDHSPRSGAKGIILVESTPEKWRKLCNAIFQKTAGRPFEENLVFVKAWNEWGEGNYLEPDVKYGCGYLEALKDEVFGE